MPPGRGGEPALRGILSHFPGYETPSQKCDGLARGIMLMRLLSACVLVEGTLTSATASKTMAVSNTPSRRAVVAWPHGCVRRPTNDEMSTVMRKATTNVNRPSSTPPTTMLKPGAFAFIAVAAAMMT